MWPYAIGKHPDARLWAEDLRQQPEGLRFVVRERGNASARPLQTALVGAYNVSNVLGVMAAFFIARKTEVFKTKHIRHNNKSRLKARKCPSLPNNYLAHLNQCIPQQAYPNLQRELQSA